MVKATTVGDFLRCDMRFCRAYTVVQGISNSLGDATDISAIRAPLSCCRFTNTANAGCFTALLLSCCRKGNKMCLDDCISA